MHALTRGPGTMKIPHSETRSAPSAALHRNAWTPILRAGALSLALEVAVRLACSWGATSEDEGVILRWMRVVVDHPWRTGLAFGLGFMALQCSSRPASGPSRRAL